VLSTPSLAVYLPNKHLSRSDLCLHKLCHSKQIQKNNDEQKLTKTPQWAVGTTRCCIGFWIRNELHLHHRMCAYAHAIKCARAYMLGCRRARCACVAIFLCMYVYIISADLSSCLLHKTFDKKFTDRVLANHTVWKTCIGIVSRGCCQMAINWRETG